MRASAPQASSCVGWGGALCRGAGARRRELVGVQVRVRVRVRLAPARPRGATSVVPGAPSASGSSRAAAAPGVPQALGAGGAAGALEEDEALRRAVADEVRDFALMNGLVMVPRGSAPGTGAHAPLTATPAPLGQERFRDALALGPQFGALYSHVSSNAEFLDMALADARKGDAAFTGRLWGILEDVYLGGGGPGAQPARLGLLRSDYLVDAESGQLLQVEMNTIASSFGCLGSLTSRMHARVAGLFPELGLEESRLPDNASREGLAAGIASAHAMWVGGASAGKDERIVCLMVVQPGEANAFDQQHLVAQLWDAHRVRVVRRSLRELADAGASLRAPSGDLVLASGERVSVVYFRAGYAPRDYPGEEEWSARLMVERSSAIKCPAIDFHLAGAKKVQQALAAPGALEDVAGSQIFESGLANADFLRSSFAGLWPADDEGAIRAALANPARYVLKPQREGGGNNLYDSDLSSALGSMPREELRSYILMDRIAPAVHRSPVLRKGSLVFVDSVSELGVFTTVLSKEGSVSKPTETRPAGHLLRTKAVTEADGGVAAGVAVLDSPYLLS